ncbi:MAG: response regulator transcription factor [Lachnospiraceae bacterium]|nr:response regulator transcription factor [Lachnospiraceae bacterium]
MIRVAICDDDREYGSWLEAEVRKVFGAGTEVYGYSSGEDYLVDVDMMHELIFLDVEMPGIDGIETAARIRKENRNAVLIFISGVRNPTPDSFKVAPYRYLLKSFSNEELEQELQEIYSETKRVFADDYLVCEKDGHSIRVKLLDILYISIVRGGCEIHTYDGHMDGGFVREKLAVLAEKLESKDFAQAHNSYLVNLRNVDSFSKTEVVLKDKTVLAISRSKYGEFENQMFYYWGRKYV